MKAKWIGLLLLLVVALGAAGYVWLTNAQQVSEIQGYVGGEKIGLLEDAEVQEILRERYKLSMDYTRAGSIEMVTMDAEGQNYLFPSNQTALELYEKAHGAPEASEIILNTPIVLYTHNAVAEALKRQGIAQESGGVTTVDMAGLTQLIESGAEWADIGLPELYGTVSVGTTDPAKSNSGNMFAGLLANTLAGGVAAEEDLPEVLPRLQEIVERLGYMESSSSDLFDQFLKTGMGAKPLIAGYESQLLEFAVQEPEVWSQIQEDIVMLYPTPPYGPPMCTLRSIPWARRGRRPFWMRTSSALPGRSTAFAPECMTRPRTSASSGWTAWLKRSPKWSPCPARR